MELMVFLLAMYDDIVSVCDGVFERVSVCVCMCMCMWVCMCVCVVNASYYFTTRHFVICYGMLNHHVMSCSCVVLFHHLM